MILFECRNVDAFHVVHLRGQSKGKYRVYTAGADGLRVVADDDVMLIIQNQLILLDSLVCLFCVL